VPSLVILCTSSFRYYDVGWYHWLAWLFDGIKLFLVRRTIQEIDSVSCCNYWSLRTRTSPRRRSPIIATLLHQPPELIFRINLINKRINPREPIEDQSGIPTPVSVECPFRLLLCLQAGSRPPGARSGWPKSFSPGVDALEIGLTGNKPIPGKTGRQRWGGRVRTRRLVTIDEVEVKRGWACDLHHVLSLTCMNYSLWRHVSADNGQEGKSLVMYCRDYGIAVIISTWNDKQSGVWSRGSCVGLHTKWGEDWREITWIKILVIEVH
jgi:hypothetical protein